METDAEREDSQFTSICAEINELGVCVSVPFC